LISKSLWLVCLIVVLFLVGCGGGNVSSEEFGSSWPLNVDSGDLRCEGSKGFGAVVFTDPDGNEYGLNGVALSQGYPPIDPIWKDSPELPGLKVSLGPLIDRGLAMCG
jgi:hypothetical protein